MKGLRIGVNVAIGVVAFAYVIEAVTVVERLFKKLYGAELA